MVAVCLVSLGGLIWLGNPAVALLVGSGIAIVADRAPLAYGAVLGKYALQTAIVLLGLRLNLETLWSLSAAYSWGVAAFVLGTLALGLALGRLLRVENASSKLVAAGTAICGGTAIATLSAVVGARPHQTGVVMAIVFLLNAVALFTFPWLGRALDMSQLEFGLWSALAIHDTSSVVATAALYGDEAAAVATTLKLGRTLWLIPLVLAASLYQQARNRAGTGQGSDVPPLRVPGFILAFIAAAAIASVVELPALVVTAAGTSSKALLVTALFLIGTEITRQTLKQIRGRVLWQALGLWAVVAPVTLVCVLWLA